MNRSGMIIPPHCSRGFLEIPCANLVPGVVTRSVDGEADYYGASQLIADQLGLKKKPRSFSKWTHGWINLRPIETPEVIIDSDCQLKKQKCFLVHTEENARMLARHGIPNGVAVGSPFLYVPTTNSPERIPGSLLVMPSHGIEEGDLSSDQKECIEHVLDLKNDFECVCFCLHEHTIKTTRMSQELDRYKVPWVQGAGLHDANSIKRQHVLFRSFEFMMSNSLGSQIPHAASLGCKVSLGGKYYERSLVEIEGTPFYRKYPQLLEEVLHSCTESYARHRIPWGFPNHPAKAPEKIDWALNELGHQNIRSVEEIANLLGWSQWDQAYYRSQEWLKGTSQTVVYQFRKRILGTVPR